ncbi:MULTISPECIES: solute carrier family 23 protein [unclassified Acinetobacter]|uniref:solute carrier family 23 protein n=1 Tax=unclassified Acinetobacter TaxID=196816 RepID=UPI002578A443|nr:MULTISPECIES: solute carrier family 23 protein [unclassified Acinetobacter]MDM1764176.1 sulfate permease [Acinetobacter sp. 226-1]MDM1767926.1 sulfate permease [Acinetobacter sp. 226-4]
MSHESSVNKKFYPSDLLSGLVVFLVALPLCLGIASASGAPLISGIIAGVIGGIVVGFLSGSHISVSGPAAGLAAIVLTQLDHLNGNYQAFLFCLVLAGILQMVFGVLRVGTFSNFIPTNVILGLLAAIGIILILNQFPILVGLEISLLKMSWLANTESILNKFDAGACLIGLISIAIILLWDKSPLKKLPLPSALLAVMVAGGLNYLFTLFGSSLAVRSEHLIHLPNIISGTETIFSFPDFSYWNNSVIYTGAITLAVVASLETLLNLEAADKMDQQKRTSPQNRELLAQGVGNTLSGLIGGMPITSVIVRSSVNATSGSKTKNSAIFHGVLLIVALLILTPLINLVPLASLAAILILTGFKLASPHLFKRLYSQGWKQFLPFIVTVVAIVATDLLVGIIIGLVLSAVIILKNNLKRGVRIIHETHLHGKLTRIELAPNISFLNRSALVSALDKIQDGETVIVDASNTYYIDPDVYQVIKDFKDERAQKHQINFKLIGFKSHYPEIVEEELDINVSTSEVQRQLTPSQVLQLLKEGNQRFVNHERLHHNIARQIQVTSQSGQHPFAAVLGCMDSRAPTERIFDVGIGDLFSLRIAGNIAGQKVLGSLEFACKSKGSKLILVLGHTDCGAVTAACQMYQQNMDIKQVKETPNVQYFLKPIMQAAETVHKEMTTYQLTSNFVHAVTLTNVKNNIAYILQNSDVLRTMVEQGEVGIIGGIYDVNTGKVEFL